MFHFEEQWYSKTNGFTDLRNECQLYETSPEKNKINKSEFSETESSKIKNDQFWSKIIS